MDGARRDMLSSTKSLQQSLALYTFPLFFFVGNCIFSSDHVRIELFIRILNEGEELS